MDEVTPSSTITSGNKVSREKPIPEVYQDVVTLDKGPTKNMNPETDPNSDNSPTRVSTGVTNPDLRSAVPALETDTASSPEAPRDSESRTGPAVSNATDTETGRSSNETGIGKESQSVSDEGSGVRDRSIVPTSSTPSDHRQGIIRTIGNNVNDTKRELAELHRTLLPKERQLLVQKEQTALDVSKYFAAIKIKVSKYLLDQEQKIQEELDILAERESQHLHQDVVNCTNLMESVDEKETQLLLTESTSRGDNSASNAGANSDLHDLRRTITGYSDMCSQMKSYADEPFEMRFMINTDLEDMMTNCNLVDIELITSRHTRQDRQSLSSETSSTRPSTSDEPDVAYAGDSASEASDSDSSVSSESEEESTEEDEEDDDEEEGEENTSPSVTQSNSTSTGDVASSRTTTTSTREKMSDTIPAPMYDDEPPPPYPGLPLTLAVPGVPGSANPAVQIATASVGVSASRSKSDWTGPPSVAVYPPTSNAPTRDSSRSEGSGSHSHGQTETPGTKPYRRRHSPDSICSSGSSTSLQETNPEVTAGNNMPDVRSRFYVDLEPTEDPEPVHPALRLPSSTNTNPSAPPMPLMSFTPSDGSERQSSVTLYPSLHTPHDVTRRSPVMTRRSPRPTSATIPSQQQRPSRRFREKTYVNPFSIKFLARCNTAISVDERPPGIVGIASMSEYIVVVDRWNYKLKLIKNRTVKSVLFFGTFEPWDVTTMSDTKCAVTVPKASEICIASRQGSKLKLEKRISTSRGYACIQYHRRQDVLICGCCPQFGRPHVAVVAMDGQVLKSFHDDANKEPIFAYPRSIAILGDDVIVVADNNKNCVIFMRMDGTVIESYKGHNNTWLHDVQGVAVHPYRGVVLVSDSKKNTLHVLSKNGHYRGILSGGTEMSNPRRLMIVGLNNPQLLVAHGNGYLSRFDLVSET